jgi:hypothetical protein
MSDGEMRGYANKELKTTSGPLKENYYAEQLTTPSNGMHIALLAILSLQLQILKMNPAK